MEMLPGVTSAALELLVRRPLRAGDAVQLASYLQLRELVDVDVAFVAFDGRLIEVATQEGATVLLPT